MSKRAGSVNKDGMELSKPFPLTIQCELLVSDFLVAIVAQLVRALVCGTRGRRFESGLSPHFFSALKVGFGQCLKGFLMFLVSFASVA